MAMPRRAYDGRGPSVHVAPARSRDARKGGRGATRRVTRTPRTRKLAPTASLAQPTSKGLMSLLLESSVIAAPVVPHDIEASPMRRSPTSMARVVYGRGRDVERRG